MIVMKKYIILSLTASAIMIGGNLVSYSAFAQEVSPAVVPEVVPETDVTKPAVGIEKRIENQQKRIDKAEEAGKITDEQAAKGEKRLTHIENKLEKAESDGKVTKNERKMLNKNLNKNSKIIHKQKKHNQ